MSTNPTPGSDILESEKQRLSPVLATVVDNELHPHISSNVGSPYPPTLPAGAAYPPSFPSMGEVNEPLLEPVMYDQTLATGLAQQSMLPSVAAKYEESTSNPSNSTIAADATQRRGSVALLITPLKRSLSWIKGVWKKPQDHWGKLSVSLLIIILVISLPLGYALRLRPFDDTVESETGDAVLQLSANLVSVDVDHLTMALDWSIANYSCPTTSCTDADLYFDQNLLSPIGGSGGLPANNNLPSQPIFRLNGTIWANDTLATLANTPTFRTEISLSNSDTTTLQAYPFDKYYAQIFLFANTSSGYISVSVSNTTGIAVGFNAELDLQDSGNLGEALLITLDISRGPAVYLYAIVIVVAIWLVTLIFMAVCVSVFLKRGIPATVLALPVAALFAFTSLRGTMPGAPPGFGADIDFIGILPCLVLLTFSSIFMIGVFLFRNPEKTIDISA